MTMSPPLLWLTISMVLLWSWSRSEGHFPCRFSLLHCCSTLAVLWPVGNLQDRS